MAGERAEGKEGGRVRRKESGKSHQHHHQQQHHHHHQLKPEQRRSTIRAFIKAKEYRNGSTERKQQVGKIKDAFRLWGKEGGAK